MRDYGRVYTAFWSSEDIRALSDDGRLLALYLLTSPHTTIAGVFRVPDGYASDDLQWGSERVSNGFRELTQKGFATRCEATKWVWIRKFLDWNGPEGPNQWKAARKVAALVPATCTWKIEFSRVFARAAGDSEPPPEEPIRMGSETHSKPIRMSESESESESEQEQESETDTSAAPTGDAVARLFEHWRTEYRHPKAVLDHKRRKLIGTALKSYSEADLREAITGYRNSTHHMGQNDSHTVYDDIGLFLRDAEHIDRGLALARSAPVAKFSSLTRRNLDATADWVPPEMRSAAR